MCAVELVDGCYCVGLGGRADLSLPVALLASAQPEKC